MKVLRPFAFAALLTATSAAQALTLIDVGSDAELTALLGGAGEPNLAFVAEGRIGDVNTARTFELDIGASTAAPASTAQFSWGNNQAVAFTLNYDAATRLAQFSFGSGTPSVQYTVPVAKSFTDLFFRARSTATSSLLLSELELDGAAFGQDVSASAGALDFLRVAGGDLADGFELTGMAKLAWTGAAPSNSALAFQIKVGDVPQIPEPSTYALLFAGLTALGFVARRRVRSA